jgi:H+-translocating NAD(P) transhydrogenase subunit alpha
VPIEPEAEGLHVVALVVPRETAAGERRVAATPDSVGRLAKLGVEVSVEAGAGDAAGHDDDAYAAAGATVVPTAELAAALASAAMVARVAPPSPTEVAALAPGTVLLSFVAPHRHLPAVRALAERG